MIVIILVDCLLYEKIFRLQINTPQVQPNVLSRSFVYLEEKIRIYLKVCKPLQNR